MIAVNNIVKTFGDTTVLNGISAEFEQGKTNLIIGQSGSGKTVFLKCILGLHQVTSGEIIYKNTPLSSMSEEERSLLRQDMGMVFQGSALFDSMTVEENVMFPMQMFTQAPKDEIRERANIVINRVNLINANHTTFEISGGMKKRVAIARAIVMNQVICFATSPTRALIPKRPS